VRKSLTAEYAEIAEEFEIQENQEKPQLSAVSPYDVLVFLLW
jgi:hypothetical protein